MLRKEQRKNTISYKKNALPCSVSSTCTSKSKQQNSEMNKRLEERMLNLDNTFLQNINLDEIAQTADDSVNQRYKNPINQHVKKKTDTNHRCRNTPANKYQVNEQEAIEELQKFEALFQNELFQKESFSVKNNKLKENDLKSPHSVHQNEAVKDVHAKFDVPNTVDTCMDNKLQTSTNLAAFRQNQTDAQTPSEELLLSNEDYLSFFEANFDNNDNKDKVGSKTDSQVLFSSIDSSAYNNKVLNDETANSFQLKTNTESQNSASSIYKQHKNVGSQQTFQIDCSQFFKSSQVVKQLDNVILHEEESFSKNNTIDKVLLNSSKDKCQLTNQTSSNKGISPRQNLSSVFKPPLDNNNMLTNKRKSLESSNSCAKIPKLNVSETSVSQSNRYENFHTSTPLRIHDDNSNIKNSEFKNEISHLFENMERSICQFGPNQDPLQQSISKFELGNMNDLHVPDELLNEIEQDAESNSVGDWIKKALKQNATKTVEPQNLVNRTVINTEVVFHEMGPFYGLPSKVKELIKLYKGIDQLYDWQDECLNLPAIKQRKNLIYSLPTSGGKTLVAEILILQEIICRKRNAILVLPYVAIVQEKVWALSPFAVALNFLVEEYAAGKGTCPPKKRRYKQSVYIATTEKASALVNSLVETGRLEEIGLVVVDELHLIGDDNRGHTLETLLTKLMFINGDIQIVGMSATIGNLSDIQQFLKAEVYIRNFRPVELVEYVKCEDQVAKINWNADKDHMFEFSRKIIFDYPEELAKIDPDRLGGLVMETVPRGSCLIFCPSISSCENVTKLLYRILPSGILKPHRAQEKQQLVKALHNDSGIICSILECSVLYGIAYHHSGLTTEERRLIEEAYRAGILCIICCTSTLAAGVNLPAKRVIIRKPYIARNFINLSRYKQMIGRAGRAGLGELGESILICSKEDLKKVKELLGSPMDQTLSKLHLCEYMRLSHLFLSCIGLGAANTLAQLEKVANLTLLAVQQDKLNVNINQITRKVIAGLFQLSAITTFEDSSNSNNTNSLSGFSVCLNSSDMFKSTESSSSLQNSEGKKSKPRLVLYTNTKLVVSKLGNAALKGSLDLSKAHTLYADLLKAQESLVLLDCLHLLYLVTPYSLLDQIKPDKNLYHTILMNLDNKERKTAKVLGITEFCMIQMLSNRNIKTVPERVLTRFYMSLMLYDLWNEVTVIDVSEKYRVNRGIVQNLMTNAATFSANVVSFCEELEQFWAFAHLLRGMSERLAHCCCRELLPLMELPAVKQSRAKQLYNAGFKNLQSIAKADPAHLTQTIEFMPHKVANQLIAAAKMLLLEKVETLREKAEDVLEGVEDPKLIFNNTFRSK